MANALSQREQFIQAMWPHAVEASRRTGVDPRIIIAQAAQETGWGEHAPNNNYFGIKSHGQGGGSDQSTREFVNGEWVTTNANFRGYGSMGESVQGYADFLLANPRYRAMMQAQGLDAQVEALGASGYATDPNYARSVGSIARSINMPGGDVTAQAAPSSNAAAAQSVLAGPAAAPVASDSRIATNALARGIRPADESMLVGLERYRPAIAGATSGGFPQFPLNALVLGRTPPTPAPGSPPIQSTGGGVGGILGGIANFLNQRNQR